MFTLNLMATSIGGFFNRNDQSEICLELYKENFIKKGPLVKNFEKIAKFLLDLDMNQNSYWFNKANAFSLFSFHHSNSGKLSTINKTKLKERLEAFEQDVPDEYALAAKEAVNNVRERSLRDEYISKLVFPK